MTDSGLTREQYEQLMKPINGSRVKMLDGMAYLEAWDVRAHLIRLFGFGGFSLELLDYEMAFEEATQTRAGKDAYRVGYRARIRLTIPALGAVYTEAAFGDSIMPASKRGDAHDLAIKTAESQALKRAAMNLGTQFGLSLYNNATTSDIVGRTLVAPEATTAEPGEAAA
jgi:recombination DNA repair RAD52 pathway protein